MQWVEGWDKGCTLAFHARILGGRGTGGPDFYWMKNKNGFLKL